MNVLFLISGTKYHVLINVSTGKRKQDLWHLESVKDKTDYRDGALVTFLVALTTCQLNATQEMKILFWLCSCSGFESPIH